MTTADDVHTLSGAYVLDALDAEEAAEFRGHLDGCAACRQEVRELRGAAARMGAVQTLEPPPGLRARVLAAVDRTPQDPPVPRPAQRTAAPPGPPDRTGGSGATEMARTTGTGTTGTRTDTAGTTGPRRRPRRWDRLVLAAAAVLLVGGGAIGLGQVLDDPRDSTGGTTAADVFQADDARTLGEPTANGGTLLVAVSPSQQHMAVDTSELPDLAGDRVYQLWSIEGEAVQSAGVFDEPGGTAAMALPGEGVTVALTIEPAGGSELPTSKPIVQVEPAAV